ncbi:MAG: bifunctional demethylmenaquinone methyltransferase/2-methoxy-6-polyprenyl-1,4-benzoquinol methylase UbiE [Phycisphaeraceae bacterium]|nr:MAG: bifunctional demethylmenaquinone methyltransferase/2-methoxy-6-polyprenyl-1,4-benzoquinol methylase UbiE [Phycisphaeraceae bacterium]
MPATKGEDALGQNSISPTAPAMQQGTEAWGDRELIDPHARADKPERVRRMFAAIAGSYDLNNRLHSFGIDQAWRRRAVRLAGVKAGDHVLDMACGTGDLTALFARTAASRVVGGDFTPEMLDIARTKQVGIGSGAAKVTYVEADAMSLPFADASFDVLSIAFGIRNVASPGVALAEFRRVLRPGGRLIVLEFDRPRNVLVRALNDFYTNQIMPRTATLISRDRSGAYRYLPRSVGTFMRREEMIDGIRAAGFSDVSATPLTFGVAVCYRGYVPGSDPSRG